MDPETVPMSEFQVAALDLLQSGLVLGLVVGVLVVVVLGVLFVRAVW